MNERINKKKVMYHFLNHVTEIVLILVVIALGVAGVLPPTTSALLHNGSTLGISLRNMTDLLDDEENPRK